MENREAIEALGDLLDTTREYPHLDGMTMFGDAIDLAISALKKQEQTNAQSVNSMRTSRPNALESLNILEQAKDDKGRVPMSLVRQAFRNILEQDRWIPFKCRDATDDDCTSFDYIMEGNLPEDGQTILITVKPDGHEPVQVDTYYDGGGEGCYLDSGYSLCDEAIAWMPLPEPYTEEES